MYNVNKQHIIPSHSKPSNQLVTQGFSLGNSTETPCSDFLRIQLNSAFWKAKSLLHNRRQLADATTFLSEHVLRASCKDDDLSTCWRNTHLDATVTIFRQLACKKLIQLGFEDPILDELQSTYNTMLTADLQ